MNVAHEVIQLEGVPMEWLATPEGRKKAQKMFSRNMYKLLKSGSTGDEPQRCVLLQAARPYRTEGTSQQCSETSSLRQK
jgi:hypothetical protein